MLRRVYALADARADITIASPAGGQPPVDPASEVPDAQTMDTIQVNADVNLESKLAVSIKLDDINADDFDAVFILVRPRSFMGFS